MPRSHDDGDEDDYSALVGDDEMEEDEQQDPSSRQYTFFERRLRLFYLLLSNTCTRDEIFERLQDWYGVALDDEVLDDRPNKSRQKTFERDIQFLEKSGYVVERSSRDGATTYHMVHGDGPGATLVFSQAELDVLVLLHTLFAHPDTMAQAWYRVPLPSPPPLNPFAQEILALIERLTTMLSPKQKREFDRSVRKPFVYLNIDMVTDYLPYRVGIDKIIKAISLQRKLRFPYAASHRQGGSTLHEQVDPYYLIHQDGHLYLIGYSYNARNARLERVYEYRVDRIDFTDMEILPLSVDAERQRHPITFHYWIDAALAHGGLSNRWLTQSVEREETIQEDGRSVKRMLIRAQAYNDFRIIQQLQKYGSRVELVDPPELREKMRQEVARLTRLYAPERSS